MLSYLSQTNILEKGEGRERRGKKQRERVGVKEKRKRALQKHGWITSACSSFCCTCIQHPASRPWMPLDSEWKGMCCSPSNSCAALQWQHWRHCRPAHITRSAALCKGGAVGTLHAAVLQSILNSYMTCSTPVSCSHTLYHLCPHISYTLLTQLLEQSFKKALLWGTHFPTGRGMVYQFSFYSTNNSVKYKWNLYPIKSPLFFYLKS